jgi:hypothetical protein
MPRCYFARFLTRMRTLYQLRRTTAAIVTRDGDRDSITIPLGAMISVEESMERDVVRVDWDGKAVWMFAHDIREHCERVWDTAVATD